MRLKIANRVFAPRPWATVLTAAALAAFVSLGGWQVGRAREKQAMMASFARGTQRSVALAGVGTDGLPRYQHVTVRGRYDPAHQILLDNMPSSTGQPGYRVLTPFIPLGSGARLLIVDRGWIALGRSRRDLPDVAVGPEERTLSGRLDQLPIPGLRMGAAASPNETGWPRVLNFPVTADLEQTLARPVESRILLLDPTAAEGYERLWRPALGFPPERHLGYALQWFALAVVALVIFIALSLEPRPEASGSKP